MLTFDVFNIVVVINFCQSFTIAHRSLMTENLTNINLNNIIKPDENKEKRMFRYQISF